VCACGQGGSELKNITAQDFERHTVSIVHSIYHNDRVSCSRLEIIAWYVSRKLVRVDPFIAHERLLSSRSILRNVLPLCMRLASSRATSATKFRGAVPR
jgi:hypothetical protein